jgi:XTP/dITP diphosphohydrolase
MKRLLLATENRGKRDEVISILKPLGIEVISLADLRAERGEAAEDWPEVIEDGRTFAENSLKKAQTFYDFSGIPTLADDSGLVVDALGGAPGVHSARYAGIQKNDADNNDKLLRELEGVAYEKRTARFVCVISFVDGGHAPLIVGGQCEGMIADEPQGEAGFGYDPLFYLPERQCTMAQLSPAEKNAISHRYQALQSFLEVYPYRRHQEE